MQKSLLQKLAFGYFLLFISVVSLNYIPTIHDDQEMMFGLFKLDLIDDILHLLTAIWALVAGFYSFGAARFYFRAFGIFYALDGVLCTIFGQCLADFTLFTHSHEITFLSTGNLMERLLLNGPHMVIGGLAIYFGFGLSRRLRGLHD